MTPSARPATETARRARRSRDARRDQLLDELQELFLREGFSTLTVDEMCRRLRCSKTTLYTVADSREQIIQAVTRHFFAGATLVIEREIAAVSRPADRILRYLDGIGRAMSSNSVAFYRDMVTTQSTAEIYRVNSRAAARRVRGMIEEGVDAGDFRAGHAVLAAESIALLIDGVQSGELLEASGLAAGEAFAELGQLLVHGLSVR